MNYALVNDTSLWHAGSKACVDSICMDAKRQGLNRLHIYATAAKIPDDGFNGCPLVIINGEGSLHSVRRHGTAGWILDAMTKAHNEGRTVWLVNSLWWGMTDGAADIVRDCCDYVQVRELFSACSMDKDGIDVALMLDASVPANLNMIPSWCREFLTMEGGLPDTRYHHGVLAGLIMRVPFTYRLGKRTPPKVGGIFAWMKKKMPAKDDPEAWAEVFHAFDCLPRFSLPVAIPLQA